MGHNSKKVVLPVEIKRRELVGKLFLTLELVNRGYTVYLGCMDIHSAIDEIEPDIYFELSAVNRDGRRTRLQRLKQCDVSTLVLDTEGSAFGDSDDFKPRVSDEIFSYTDCYCAWGPQSAEIAKTENRDSETQIEATGNPRFDVLQEPYRRVYANEAKTINEKYDDFVLFNTNFSVNHMDLDHNKEQALTDPTDMYKNQTKLVGEFLTAIGTVAEELTDHNIVIRPHPSEDPSLYKRLFSPYENVHVNKEGEVRPWILASDAVVHNSCTTGVTSALLETPVFAYIPRELSFSEIPNVVSTQCHSLSALVDNVTDAVEEGTSYTMNEEQTAKLQSYIGNIDYVAAERIADIIDSMDHGRPSGFGRHFSPGPKHSLKRQLVRVMGSNRFGPIYYGRLLGGGSVSYKFSKTTLDEIKSLVSSFPDSVGPDRLDIDPLPGVVYSFRFQPR